MGKEKLKSNRDGQTLVNKLGKFERLNQEELKLLINRTVPGLAMVEVYEGKWTGMELQVDLKDQVPLSAYFQGTMTDGIIMTILWNTIRIANDCERHGLRVDGLRWDYDRVYVNPEGDMQMVYWPVTTLEQYAQNPLSFYRNLAEPLAHSGVDKSISDAYAGYFYQRTAFDVHQFYNLMAKLVDQWQGPQRRNRPPEQDHTACAVIPDKMDLVIGSLVPAGPGEEIVLDRQKTYLGRDPSQCHGVISGYKGVSRAHAVIYCQDNQYYVQDLDSRNGTFLQGKQIAPGQGMPLTDGMELRFADASYTFRQVDLDQTISIHQLHRR